MKAKYFITQCSFLILLIVSMVGMIGCMSNDFKDADMVIKVPDTAPPHLKT